MPHFFGVVATNEQAVLIQLLGIEKKIFFAISLCWIKEFAIARFRQPEASLFNQRRVVAEPNHDSAEARVKLTIIVAMKQRLEGLSRHHGLARTRYCRRGGRR